MITHLAVGSKIQFENTELTVVKDLSGGYRLTDNEGKYKTTQPVYCTDLLSIEMLDRMTKYIVL